MPFAERGSLWSSDCCDMEAYPLVPFTYRIQLSGASYAGALQRRSLFLGIGWIHSGFPFGERP